MKPHIAYDLRGRQSIAQKNMSDERNNCVRAKAARMVDERTYITLESRIFRGKIWWCSPTVALPKSQRDGRGSMARKVCY